MTKKTRDWLFGIFVFLFVVITITLSLFATGYRLNLSWPLRFDRLLLKTGTLALDTEPAGATVLITSETKISTVFSFNSSSKEKTTPVKIKNLLPGEYTVTFSLDNYWPYEKKLRVNPEQTTFLENVILFKKSLPLNVLSVKPQEISYCENGNYAWLKSDNEIISLKTEQVVTKLDSKKINWINGGKQILDGSKLITLDSGNVYDYKIEGAEEIQLSSDGLIVYLSKNNLAVLNPSTNTTSIIPTEGTILSYGINNNILLIIILNKEKTEIKSFDLTKNKFLNSSELLTSKSFSLNQDNNKNPILTDNEHKIIYLLSINNGNIIVENIIRSATVFKWLDGNRLAYVLESEVYIYDISQNKSNLITRLSEKINSLSWSTNNYLIYSTENAIGTINLTDAGNDITILWQGNNLSSLYFEEKSGILYFSGAIGQQSGLYKMSLR